jgi:hypothetical protein
VTTTGPLGVGHDMADTIERVTGVVAQRSPNPDHYPTLKRDGGMLKPWNVRLAHLQQHGIRVAEENPPC